MPEYKLHKYQEGALAFALAKKSCYCALDMGMGKTAVALNWSKNILPEVGGVLVVAPIRTIYSSWPEELAKWTPELSYSLLHGPLKDVALRQKTDFYFINYEGLQWLLIELKKIFKATGKVPFRAIILDEGSKAKAPNTKRFGVLKILADVAPKYKLILSGTPSPNSLLDLWAQYFFLDKGKRLGGTITAYRAQYFTQYEITSKKLKSGEVRQQGRKIFGYIIKPFCADIIHERIGDITYRLDAKDYLEVPPKIINEIKVKLPPKLMAQYKTLEETFFLELEKTDIEAMSAPSLAMKLRQFVQGGLYLDEPKVNGERPYTVVHQEKLSVLEELVEDASGQGILCAIQFRFELDMIRKKFPDAPVIAGGTSPVEAGKLIKQWNAGELPLLLCHPGSLSHGVNLQTGSHLIVWFGLTWSLEQYEQFNARLHRQGQINTVIIHHLVVAGTIDEDIMRALKSKFKGQRKLLDYLKGLR